MRTYCYLQLCWCQESNPCLCFWLKEQGLTSNTITILQIDAQGLLSHILNNTSAEIKARQILKATTHSILLRKSARYTNPPFTMTRQGEISSTREMRDSIKLEWKEFSSRPLQARSAVTEKGMEEVPLQWGKLRTVLKRASHLQEDLLCKMA